MFCKKCGNQIPIGAQFCNVCGTAVQEQKHTAVIWKRLINVLVDGFVGFIFNFATLFFIGLVLADIFWLFWPTAILIYTGIFYYVFFEAIFQRTPSKWMTGTKVVRLDGTKPHFWQIVGRTLARYIPFEALSFLFGEYPYGWHDRLSKTMVVPAEYSVEEAATIDPKNKGKSSIAAIIVGIIIGLFVLIAVLGILAGIVLASLGSAREQSQDAYVMEAMSSARLNAEIYWTEDRGYEGVCDDPALINNLNTAAAAGATIPAEASYGCYATNLTWVAVAPMRSGEWVCVDSTGELTTVENVAVDGLLCSDFPGYIPQY